jgi:flagellar basal body-associated protein FliL
LYGVIAAQLVAIALVTARALMAKPVPVYRETQPYTAAVSDAPQQNSVFTGIGRLRARLAAPVKKNSVADDGAAAVITVVFPYDGSDRAFLEELSLNTRKFRSITTDYFNSIPPDSPLLSDEATLKLELLSKYNSLLYLGRIETLYFTEFIIID